MHDEKIIGEKFGRLTVIEFTSGNSHHSCVICRCDCGKITTARIERLKRGAKASCGCLYSTRNFKHGLCNTKIWRTWNNLRNRINNINDSRYNRYGGRGIKCEWDNFLDFFSDMYLLMEEHIKKYGENNTTIERINNNGNYSKENCRWATWKEQNKNRRY